MQPSDRERVERCLDGHPDAYRDLVCRYQGALLSFLTGRLGNRERAEEAAQEAFVRAFFVLKKLKKPDAFFSWLLGIAARVAKEQQRAHRGQVRLPDEVLEKREAPPSAGDLELEQAVSRLPDSCREVVLLRYYGDFSCAQIAGQLKVALGTVTKRLSRAYAMLRESLDPRR